MRSKPALQSQVLKVSSKARTSASKFKSSLNISLQFPLLLHQLPPFANPCTPPGLAKDSLSVSKGNVISLKGNTDNTLERKWALKIIKSGKLKSKKPILKISLQLRHSKLNLCAHKKLKVFHLEPEEKKYRSSHMAGQNNKSKVRISAQ